MGRPYMGPASGFPEHAAAARRLGRHLSTAPCVDQEFSGGASSFRRIGCHGAALLGSGSQGML